MGKGGGCVLSKKSFLVASERKEAPMEARSPNTPATAEEVNTSLEDVPPSPAVNARKLKIFIVFYSMYGHMEKLARRMKKGVDEMEGVEGLLFRVPETLPFDVLEQMKAPEKDNDIPTISAAEYPLSLFCNWTAITQLCHHGMLFVPIGYTFGAGMFKMDDIRGGSPYGAGVFAGDGSRQPSEAELALAEHQGRYMAGVVKRLAAA